MRWKSNGADWEIGSQTPNRGPGGQVAWWIRGWRAWAWTRRKEWYQEYKTEAGAKRAVERWLAKEGK